MSFDSFDANPISVEPSSLSELATNPENIHSFEGEYVAGLPASGGKFVLPAETRIRKPDGSIELLQEATEVFISPISRDIARLRALRTKTITPERANTLPPSECTFDTRRVSQNGRVLGTVTGDQIYEVNNFLSGDHE